MKCPQQGCEFDAGHDHEHPHGRRVVDGEPCHICGQPNPCGTCWQPMTPAMLKGLAAEAGRSVDIR